MPLWQRLLGAGAVPAGALACEALRVGEGLPRYGADMSDRTLPQETGLAHALNFNKGCYLGQEIVERIRSQAKVHGESACSPCKARRRRGDAAEQRWQSRR